MEERYLSLAEACEVLGKTERTLYRWIKSGKLKAYKPGRDYEIPVSAIQEMRERSEVYPKDLAPRLPLDDAQWRGAAGDGVALAHVLREMQERYAPGKVLHWSREDLERVAARTDEAAFAQFALAFEAGHDELAQEIAMSGGAVSALLRARAPRAPTQSTKTSRLEAQAVEQKLAGMAA